MKKTFYQFSFYAFFLRFVVIALIIMGLYIIGESISRANILGLIGLLPLILGATSYYVMFYNRIIFLDEIIDITGDKGKDSERIQFKDEIAYSDISDIRLVYANLNSKKKRKPSPSLGNLQPNMFFEFVLINQKTKWVYVSVFSKKQRKEMLEIINSKTGKNFSYDTLEREDSSMYKKKEK